MLERALASFLFLYQRHESEGVSLYSRDPRPYSDAAILFPGRDRLNEPISKRMIAMLKPRDRRRSGINFQDDLPQIPEYSGRVELAESFLSSDDLSLGDESRK